MDNPKVSIVIPCYNYAHFLGECIESCLSQTYPNIEIVVVDDGSPDNTREVAEKYPVKYVWQANKGLPGARNTGIREATGQWIMCLDADDKIDEECIEKCMQLAGEADVIAPGQQNFGDNSIFYPLTNRTFTYDAFKSGNQIHCASLFRKELWQKVEGYDENMTLGYEDWEFWLRLAKEKARFRVVPEPLFFYRKHGKTMVDNASAHQAEIIQYIKQKHNEENC